MMYYALTINKDHVITGVHESMSQITADMFRHNQDLSDDSVVVINAPADFQTGIDARCYNENGTYKPLVWCIENGFMPMPPNAEIINGELVYKEVPVEEQPQTIKEYLDEQLLGIKKESLAEVNKVSEVTNGKLQSIKPLMTELVKGKPADVVIQSSEFILPWEAGEFAIDDVRLWNGQPKRCCQAHNSIGNPTWTPNMASLWAPYHGKKPDTALVWVNPTGAQDMYKAGEFMIWTDGSTYRCKQDTAYSPIEYPQAWEI